MKAKKISESSNFERGGGRKSLDLGGADFGKIRDSWSKDLAENKARLENEYDESWNEWLKKNLLDKKVTGRMTKMAVFDKTMSVKKSNSETGNFTVIVRDLVAESLNAASVVLLGDDENLYSLALYQKIYIEKI